MIDIMQDDKEISKALNVLNSISDTLRYEKICEISEAKKNTYLSEGRKTQKRRHRGKQGAAKRKVVGIWDPTLI